MAEPFGMFLHPGMIRRALHRQIERQLHSQFFCAAPQRMEIIPAAELGMDRRMASLFRPDRPRAPHIIGGGRGGVVATLAKRPTDGVDRREIEHVESHRVHVVEPIGQIGKRAMAARLQRPGAGKNLIPGTPARPLPIDPHTSGLLQMGLLAPVGKACHQLPQPVAGGHCGPRWGLKLECQLLHFLSDLSRRSLGRCQHQLRPHLQIDLRSLPRLLAPAQIAQPRAKRVDPG